MEKTTTLLPIGRFSRLSGLTVKALRHYDEIGLLRPARVDGETGYRYYALEQLSQGGAIARLRGLGVPLEECRAILAEAGDGGARERLRRYRSELRAREVELKEKLSALDALIEGKESLQAPAVALEKIEVRELPEQPALTVRCRVSREELDATISRSINAVVDYLRELGERWAGPPFTIGADADDEDVLSVEIGWPTRESLPARGDVESRLLPDGKAAWAVYRGPYDRLPDAYRTVFEWIDAHAYEVAGDPRELYYTDPDEVPDPADYVTGIVWPIR